MYYRKDGQRLKTKIIATIGEENRILFDLKGKRHKKGGVKYKKLFDWFVHREQEEQECFMVDLLRLNMAFYSDATKAQYESIFTWLEDHKETLAKDVGVLCDLAGAKTRLAQIANGKVKLNKGRPFQLEFKTNRPGDKDRASVLAYGKPLAELHEYTDILSMLEGPLEQGKTIMISVGDGKTALEAISLQNDVLNCVVAKEGVIKSNWGITFEGLDLGLPSFRKPDQDALKFLLDLDNDRGFLSFIGVSFVRGPKDVLAVRQFVERYFKERGYTSDGAARLRCPDIIAKIETKEGADTDNIKEILDVADGAMIARGDLALQLTREEVPEKQKKIISLCNKRGKIVITATEMLASMEDNPKPTRAEVNDVFNAILDGTDAVMLSGETSSGKYPANAVDYMVRIAEKAEKYFEEIYARKSPLNTQRIQELRKGSEDLAKGTDSVKGTNPRLEEKIQDACNNHRNWEERLYQEKLERSKDQGTTDRICAAACELAEEEEFKAIIVSTASGRTVRMISRFRPSVELVGVTYDEKCRRKLLLSYGACSLSVGEPSPSTGKAWQNPEAVFQKAAQDCLKQNLGQKGDHIIFVSGTPLGRYGHGKVNILQVKEMTDTPQL